MTKGKGYDVKDDVKFAINCYWDDTQGEGNHTHFVSGYTQTTGQSKEYMPPYMTVYAWYRVQWMCLTQRSGLTEWTKYRVLDERIRSSQKWLNLKTSILWAY